MEYCEVGALADVIDLFGKKEMPKFTTHQVSALLQQTVNGLAFLHSEEVRVVCLLNI